MGGPPGRYGLLVINGSWGSQVINGRIKDEAMLTLQVTEHVIPITPDHITKYPKTSLAQVYRIRSHCV
jgi:hypothetical protein